MRRISTLVLAGALLLGSFSAAQAADVKIKGAWDFEFGFADNVNYETGHSKGSRDNDIFSARQRVRTQVNFIANENLQGVLAFEIGTLTWGQSNGNVGRSSGGALDGDGVNIETKRAYLDWMVPNTDLSIRMGLQGLALPMATGYYNPVFSADVAAIVANYKFSEMVSLTSFWARPFDEYDNDSNGAARHLADEMDMFGLVLPISGNGWNVTPWGMVANIGNASGLYNYIQDANDKDGKRTLGLTGNEHAIAWWAGTGFKLDLYDPLTFGIDVIYGDMHKNEVSGPMDHALSNSEGVGTRGWFIASNLNYKLDWATPGLFGWWSSGDSANAAHTGQYGRLPTVGTDDGFAPTSFGFPGSNGIANDSAISLTATGTWGVGAQLADMSFIEDLEHTLRVAFYQGTNHKDAVANGANNAAWSFESVYMTTEDNAIEVNFDHKYQIYENLAAYLELGYIHLDMSNRVWGSDAYNDNLWKAQVLFQYKF